MVRGRTIFSRQRQSFEREIRRAGTIAAIFSFGVEMCMIID